MRAGVVTAAVVVAVMAGAAGCGASHPAAPGPAGRCAAAFRVLEQRGISRMRPAQIRAHGDQADLVALQRAESACDGLSSAEARQVAAASSS